MFRIESGILLEHFASELYIHLFYLTKDFFNQIPYLSKHLVIFSPQRLYQ